MGFPLEVLVIPLVVLIPTHERPALLRRALRSVAACARPEGYAGCVVVENGPAAGAEGVVAEVAAEHPGAGLRYVHVERANKSAALNAALADVADETLAVFLDDDVRVDPGLLEAYAAAAAGQKGRAFFGGPLEVDYEEDPAPWVRAILPASARGATPNDLEEMGFFMGANWAALAGDLHAVGGFDPNYGPGSPRGARGREADMQRRLRAAEVEATFVRGARAWHYVPTERCTPEWVVQRMFASGMGNGSRARSGQQSVSILRGCHVVAAQAPRYVVARARGKSDEQARSAAYLAFWLGYFRGYIQRPT